MLKVFSCKKNLCINMYSYVHKEIHMYSNIDEFRVYFQHNQIILG